MRHSGAPIPRALTVTEAAEATGNSVSVRTLYREIKDGQIRVRKIRGTTRILDEELARWLRDYEANTDGGGSSSSRSVKTPAASPDSSSGRGAGEVASSETSTDPIPQPIKAEMASRRISIRQLSDSVGCNPNTLGRVINGHSTPWPALRQRCAEALGVDESNLFRVVDR